MFLKPGKQNIFVYHGPKNVYYSGHVIFCREETIPGYAKEMKAGRKKREYNHNLGVFATWKPDDSKTIEECLEHDQMYWKVGRFLKDDLLEEQLV